jgi:hypothetical protein
LGDKWGASAGGSGENLVLGLAGGQGGAGRSSVESEVWSVWFLVGFWNGSGHFLGWLRGPYVFGRTSSHKLAQIVVH